MRPPPLHPPHSYFSTSSPSLHTKPHPSLPPALIQGPHVASGLQSPNPGVQSPRILQGPPTIVQVTPPEGAPGRALLLALLHRRPWPALEQPCPLLAKGQEMPAPGLLGGWAGLTSLDIPPPPSPSPRAARLWLHNK
ncbi:unnamed protein product [Rangifer tarandus platyrhynchus]|uniref:Uncharacterized protein n=2 Tax=Rangifer tarandus platyrhynchus TaxID=3082113 RepID=A0ABN8YM52_RANTA|nr:unnamed protein product [Rangifer tarandus platyrhynchus]